MTDLEVRVPDSSERRPRSPLVTLALCAAGVISLWLLRSSLAAVYGDLGDIAGIDPRWLLAVVGCEAAAFVASWDLNRVALRTNRWFDVAVAQLTGNAATNLVPAGGAAGAAVQLRVLTEAGFDLTRAATSLGALSILGAAGLLALPVIALPLALATGASDPRLEAALWLGVVLLIGCLAVTVVLLTRDGPLERLAAALQWVRNRLLPRDVRRDLPARVLAERDSIAAAVRERPGRVVGATVTRTVSDFVGLYLSLLAVGVHPSPSVVLIAFAAGNVAGMIPLTPGGIGFVEAGITGVLVAAGIDPAPAALAAALYRVANTWLPVLVALPAYGWFRRRHRPPGTHAPAPPSGRAGSRQFVMIAVAALGLLLVSPVLVKVYGHIGDTFALAPGWLLAIAAMIVAHFLSVWALYRVILRTSNRFDVAASQLAANATSHVAPAGSAVGAGIQLRMLTIAGFSASRAATAPGATAVLGTVAGYLVLPLAVLVASAAGGGVPPRLVGAMWSAAAVLAILLVLAAVLAARDRPWRWAGGAVTWVQHRFRRAADAHELGDRLIDERNLILGAIRDQAAFVAAVPGRRRGPAPLPAPAPAPGPPRPATSAPLRRSSTLAGVSTTRIARHIRAPRARVYRALLERDAVQRWMVPDEMTSEVHTYDAREGGTFRISLTYDQPTTAGKTSARTDTFHGRFVELVPDTKVVQAVEFETDEPAMQGEMTITYLLADADGGTDVVGVHEDLPPGVPPADNETGWSMSMDKLARLVETGP